MRIINLRDSDAHDIEAALLELASNDDRVESLKGRKLLELVRHLTTQGPAPEACGVLFDDELWLSPRNVANRVRVQVWVDWFDRAPLQDGLPEPHYRLQIRRGNRVVTQDARAASTADAEQVIWDAFGWSS